MEFGPSRTQNWRDSAWDFSTHCWLSWGRYWPNILAKSLKLYLSWDIALKSFWNLWMAFVGGGAQSLHWLHFFFLLLDRCQPLLPPAKSNLSEGLSHYSVSTFSEDIFDKFLLDKRLVWMWDGSWRWLLQFNVNEGLSDSAQPTSALIRKVINQVFCGNVIFWSWRN